MVLAFPGANLFWLAWFALIPLLAALGGKNIQQAFGLGFITGLTASAGYLRWIPGVIFHITKLPMLSFIGAVVPAIYSALYVGIFSVFVSYINSRYVFQKSELSRALYLITIPSLWAGLEYIQSRVFTGFPWTYHFLGYTQWNNLRIIQLSEFTAVYGVSFLIVLFNASFLYAIKKRSLRPFGIVLFVVVLCFLYGVWKVDMVAPKEKGGDLRVGILQGNIDPLMKWEDKKKTGNFIAQRYLDLNRAIVKESPDIVVWTETAIPWPLAKGDNLIEDALKITQPIGASHIIGIPARVSGEEEAYHNAVFFILPDGRITSQYNKMRLLDFTEHNLINPAILKKFGVMGQMEGYVPGDVQKVLQTPFGKIGILICNENFYPDYVRMAIKKGAELLINMGNDSWFPSKVTLVQHYIVNIFRAVENRRDVVVSSSAGFSGFIDAYGRTMYRIPEREAAVAAYNVKRRKAQSFYTKYGDVFSYICILFAFGGIIYAGGGKKE